MEIIELKSEVTKLGTEKAHSQNEAEDVKQQCLVLRNQLSDLQVDKARTMKQASSYLSQLNDTHRMTDQQSAASVANISSKFPIPKEIRSDYGSMRLDERGDFLDDCVDCLLSDEEMPEKEKQQLPCRIFFRTYEIADTKLEEFKEELSRTLKLDSLNSSGSVFLTTYLQTNFKNKRIFDSLEVAKKLRSGNEFNSLAPQLFEKLKTSEHVKAFYSFVMKCLDLCLGNLC
eukprot:TRINITY_DN10721_c0_g1_i1.p1 TRINITY_DN10721_c0_g1~~TRINITY_DN10721_c0_g1_i1.p1  ORF type:complete len:230 (+),score=35.72 TRINITY_DN10721_c0_g1_i1:115-804(+)